MSAGSLVVAGLAGVLDTSAAVASTATSYALPASGSITVDGHGNGHGHGLSQYGALGGAQHHLYASQIVGFYYPGTTLVTKPASTTMRVWLSEAGHNTCVVARAGMTATWSGGKVALPKPAATLRYRLIVDGSGLTVQRGGKSCVGTAGWTTIKKGLPARVDFSSTQGYVGLRWRDGTSTDYRGTVGAVRQGSGMVTVNRVSLDGYTEGVVPREVPASWRLAAVHAQAIAARSYGEFSHEHPSSSAYDICDYDQCQVYGGMTHYSSTGAVLWRDDPDAVSAYQAQVVAYKGATAFTQFSSSDGGWTVDGGQPYLVAKADKYDDTATGDPYLNWTRTVPVSAIAGYYGLARVTKITVTKRDGNGQWGGRVLTGTVTGLTSSGKATTVSTTGPALQSAMDLPHDWFAIVT